MYNVGTCTHTCRCEHPLLEIPRRDFVQIMGHMDVIGFIADGFNIYFPIAIVLLCVLTLFNVGTRILNVLGIQQFMVDDDITQELVDEGKEIVRRGLDSIISFC